MLKFLEAHPLTTGIQSQIFLIIYIKLNSSLLEKFSKYLSIYNIYILIPIILYNLQHPISRFISRYMLNSEQQNYEKSLHYLYEENEKAQIR